MWYFSPLLKKIVFYLVELPFFMYLSWEWASSHDKEGFPDRQQMAFGEERQRWRIWWTVLRSVGLFPSPSFLFWLLEKIFWCSHTMFVSCQSFKWVLLFVHLLFHPLPIYDQLYFLFFFCQFCSFSSTFWDCYLWSFWLFRWNPWLPKWIFLFFIRYRISLYFRSYEIYINENL